MMFFIRKKEVVLDCFTKDPVVYNLFKINHAKQFLPDWWKELPSQVRSHADPTNPFAIGSTMRTCAGLIDYYKTGVMLPAWSDMGFEVGKFGTGYVRVSIASPVSGETSQHPASQRGKYLPSESYSHIKITSPWVFKMKKPIQFVLLKPLWNYSAPEEIIIPPGCVNFKYQHSTNINLFLKHEKEIKIIRIDAGTPLLHWIPQSDDKIIIKNHLVDEIEFNTRVNISYHRFSYSNGYAKYKKMISNQYKKKWWNFSE